MGLLLVEVEVLLVLDNKELDPSLSDFASLHFFCSNLAILRVGKQNGSITCLVVTISSPDLDRLLNAREILKELQQVFLSHRIWQASHLYAHKV